METEYSLNYEKYIKDAVSNFIPAMVFLKAIIHQLEPVDDLVGHAIRRTMQPAIKAIFAPR